MLCYTENTKGMSQLKMNNLTTLNKS